MTLKFDKCKIDWKVKDYKNIIDKYDTNPITVSTNGAKVTYNGKDINNYLEAEKDINKQLQSNITAYNSPLAIDQVKRGIYAKYGIDKNKQDAIETNSEMLKIRDISKNALTEYNKSLNQEAINRGYVFNPTEVRWTKGSTIKKDSPEQLTDETIVGNIRNYVRATYNGDYGKASPNLDKNLNEKGADPHVDVSWNPNTKKYKLTIQSKDHDPSTILLNESEAANLGVPQIKPREGHASKLLKLYGGQTWPQGKPMNFETALPLATIGPLEFRMHIEDNGNNYIIQPYKVDTRKSGAKVETMPDIVTNTHNYDEVAKYLQRLTGQYTRQDYGNTDALTNDQTEQLNEQ